MSADRQTIDDAVTLDVAVLSKEEHMERLQRKHKNKVNRPTPKRMEEIGREILRLTTDDGSKYFTLGNDGVLGSGKYEMSLSKYADQIGASESYLSSYASLSDRLDRSLGVAKVLAETVFKTELRVVDVLADGDCGRYVKSLLTGMPIDNCDAPFGKKGSTNMGWLDDDELVDDSYDLVVLLVNFQDGTLKAGENDSHLVHITTPPASKPFHAERPKAVVVNFNRSHWFILAPVRGLAMNRTVPLYENGKSTLLWEGEDDYSPDSDFHEIMKNAEDFSHYSALFDENAKKVFQTKSSFTDYCV